MLGRKETLGIQPIFIELHQKLFRKTLGYLVSSFQVLGTLPLASLPEIRPD